MRKPSSASDRYTAIAVLVFTGVFAWQTAHLQNRLDVIFPKFLLAGLAVMAVLLLVLTFVSPPVKKTAEAKRDPRKATTWAGIAVTLAWVYLLPIVGFAVTSVVALTALTLLLGDKQDRSPTKAIAALVVSTVIVVMIHFAFSTYLEVPLPRGRFL